MFETLEQILSQYHGFFLCVIWVIVFRLRLFWVRSDKFLTWSIVKKFWRLKVYYWRYVYWYFSFVNVKKGQLSVPIGATKLGKLATAYCSKSNLKVLEIVRINLSIPHPPKCLRFMVSSVHRKVLYEKWNLLSTSQLRYIVLKFTITNSSSKPAQRIHLYMI